MRAKDFQLRTKELALAVSLLADSVPRTRSAEVMSRQAIKCSTSVGANYRAACRSRSDAEMIAKLHIVLEEADETMYWLELLRDAKHVAPDQVEALLVEANEVVAMTVASLRKLKSKQQGLTTQPLDEREPQALS